MLAVACACQHDAPPPSADPYHQLELRMPHVVRILQELNESLQATAGDCRLVAQTLRRFGLEHRADLAEVTRLEDQLSADQRERFELEHADDRKGLDLHFGCDADPEVQSAREIAGFRRTH